VNCGGRRRADCGRSGRRATPPADHLEIPLLARGPALLDHQLDAADDRLERIVDLVRHAGDELADRRQPLGVHQLIASFSSSVMSARRRRSG
jgi:hypothetical protein